MTTSTKIRDDKQINLLSIKCSVVIKIEKKGRTYKDKNPTKTFMKSFLFFVSLPTDKRTKQVVYWILFGTEFLMKNLNFSLDSNIEKKYVQSTKPFLKANYSTAYLF